MIGAHNLDKCCGNSPLSENGLIITKPCGVIGAKIVDLGKQIQEIKVQINHLSCAQGGAGRNRVQKQGRGAEKSQIGFGKQGRGILRTGITFIVKVRF